MSNDVSKYEASVTDFVLIFSMSLMGNFLGHSLRPEVRTDLKNSRTIILAIAFMAMMISFLWFQKEHHFWDMMITAIVAFVWFVALTRLYTGQIFVVLGVLVASLLANDVKNGTADSISEHYAKTAQLGLGILGGGLTAYWAFTNGPGTLV